MVFLPTPSIYTDVKCQDKAASQVNYAAADSGTHLSKEPVSTKETFVTLEVRSPITFYILLLDQIAPAQPPHQSSPALLHARLAPAGLWWLQPTSASLLLPQRWHKLCHKSSAASLQQGDQWKNRQEKALVNNASRARLLAEPLST